MCIDAAALIRHLLHSHSPRFLTGFPGSRLAFHLHVFSLVPAVQRPSLTVMKENMETYRTASSLRIISEAAS